MTFSTKSLQLGLSGYEDTLQPNLLSDTIYPTPNPLGVTGAKPPILTFGLNTVLVDKTMCFILR